MGTWIQAGRRAIKDRPKMAWDKDLHVGGEQEAGIIYPICIVLPVRMSSEDAGVGKWVLGGMVSDSLGLIKRMSHHSNNVHFRKTFSSVNSLETPSTWEEASLTWDLQHRDVEGKDANLRHQKLFLVGLWASD